MSFEEVLGNCLADLEQGSSVEACLARYPAYAAELAPILRLITPMRTGPKPRLSARAFARGRAAVAAYARQQQQVREPFITASPRAAQTRPFYAPATPLPGVKPAQVKPLPAPIPARSFRQMHSWLRLLVVLLFVITFASFVRGVANSLPGSFLYPVKGWGENAQGLIMMASGQQPSWHVNQLTRRLTEYALLTQQGAAVAPALTTAIDEQLQAALDGSSTLSPEQRQQFLATWLANLHTLQQGLPAQPATVATLSRVITTVEQASQANNGPTILPVKNTPTNTPAATAVVTYTPASLPTVTPTPTDTPSPRPSVALPTPTPDASLVTTPVSEVTLSPTPVVVEPTATPTALVETPTFTSVPPLMPEEQDDDRSDSSNNNSSAPTATALPATDTPVATVPAPHIPLPTTTGTGAGETPASETPVAPEQTPLPGGIPTSAEPPTPAPTEASKSIATPAATKPPEPTATKQAETTPTAKAATPTPNRGDSKTSTPEPTKAENGAPTNTPKPDETKAETPAPEGDVSAADGTPEAGDGEKPTPAPTPTKKKKK